MKTIEFQLEELSCPSCIKKIERTLSKVAGVRGVRVLFNASKVQVETQGNKAPEELAGIIGKLGYPVRSQRVKKTLVEP